MPLAITRPGKFLVEDRNDLNECQGCPVGRYSDRADLPECKECDEDDFCPANSTEKRPCPTHSTFDTESEMCICAITHFAVRGVFKADVSPAEWTGTLCHRLDSVAGLEESACAQTAIGRRGTSLRFRPDIRMTRADPSFALARHGCVTCANFLRVVHRNTRSGRRFWVRRGQRMPYGDAASHVLGATRQR